MPIKGAQAKVVFFDDEVKQINIQIRDPDALPPRMLTAAAALSEESVSRRLGADVAFSETYMDPETETDVVVASSTTSPTHRYLLDESNGDLIHEEETADLDRLVFRANASFSYPHVTSVDPDQDPPVIVCDGEGLLHVHHEPRYASDLSAHELDHG